MSPRPAIIVSMQFFNYPAATTSKTPQNEGTKVTTDFFDADEQQIGISKTDNGYTTSTTTYFDMRNNVLGRSESKWEGSFIRTFYFTGETLVGASKTFWGGTQHMTNYFDLEHNVINFSRTKKEGAKSNTDYNLPIPTGKAMLSEYSEAPPSFFTSPILEKTREEDAKKNSQFSSSSSTMHRAQPTTSQKKQGKLKVEPPKNKEGKCCSIM